MIADHTSEERDREMKAKRIKELQKEIAAVKGTPAAKALVEEYRTLTNTQ